MSNIADVRNTFLESPNEIIESIPPVSDRGFFTSEDGVGIYYEVMGKGKPLIFCYGLVCRREHWRHQLAHFGEHYQLITFDYRGHHRSDVPKNLRHLTIEWCARDVIQLTKHLGLEDVALFGHSLGVPVSAVVASELKERVKALILICGSVVNPFDGMFHTDRMDTFFKYYSKAYEFAPGMLSLLWRQFTDLNRFSIFLTSRFGFNPYLAEERDILGYMEGVNSIPLPIFYSILRDYTQFDGRPHLTRITAPSLIIAGMEDCITPMKLQEEMARIMPQSQLEKIPMGSHNAHMDLPEMVNQKVEDFFAKVGFL